jgi:4-amino-4-deoxy-L-arabinose transferase-like glycosyltransferase
LLMESAVCFMKILRSVKFQLAMVLLLAAAWKMVLIFWEVVPFNSDEAVVALMARHILMGERPVFFYGQAYMGSLDAFLVALGFLVFGQQVWVIRLVQALLYLGTILTTYWIGKEAFDAPKVGILAALLLAIPTVNVSLYTTASLGGYGEALLIGNLTLLVTLVLVRRRIRMVSGIGKHSLAGSSHFPWLGFGLWGLLVGCGLWANGLTLVFSAPAGLYLFWSLWSSPATWRTKWLAWFALAAGVGFIIGSLPWWIFAAVNGPSHLILELLGTAVAVEQASWLIRTGMHLVNFLLLGLTVIFGLRPPWGVNWLGLPLLPFALAFWVGVMWFFGRKFKKSEPQRSEYALLAGVIGTLLAGFLFTAFGVDPSGRYFLPLAIPLALVAAQMVLCVPRWRWQTAGLVVLVVVYQFWGTMQSGLRFPPGLTTQFYEPSIIDHRADGALVAFLREAGETRGYSNYWVTYPLAFHSREDLIFVPCLPYHQDLRYTPRDDRYVAYDDLVQQSQRVAYITTRNPVLDQYLRDHFKALGVAWQEKQIGDYQVYYHLSSPVRPQEIGLGELSE